MEEDKSDVDDATSSFMGQELSLDHRYNCKRQCEENCKNLESDQFWERLIDVAPVAKAQSEVLERHPNYHWNQFNNIAVSCLDFMDLTQKHHYNVDYLVGAVVEE